MPLNHMLELFSSFVLNWHIAFAAPAGRIDGSAIVFRTVHECDREAAKIRYMVFMAYGPSATVKAACGRSEPLHRWDRYSRARDSVSASARPR